MNLKLKDTSIQNRLMRVILITCGATLLLTFAAYFGYEYFNFRETYLTQLSNIGKIIASNSTAALAFDSPDDANEILASLKIDPHIVGACLYDNDGKLFATYPDNTSAAAFPAKPHFEGYRSGSAHFEGFQPVVQANNRLGTLYLKTDMKAMYELFAFFSVIAVLVFSVSFLFAYFLSKRLQKGISQPILALAKTSKSVSENRDYSVRAVKYTSDELGLLTDAFNQMLSQIETQNLEIISFNQKLEQKVSERTTQLESVNKELEAFSYSVSHDLRSPLRALSGYSKIFEEEYAGAMDNEAKRLLNSIQANAQKMGRLIDDLLAFSKLGRKEVRKTMVNMEDIVVEALKGVNEAFNHRAYITVKPLPPALADSALIYQVWMNFISNAVKYSSKKENPEVEIGASVKDNGVVYYVKDNGAGFNMGYANKLFNVFQRLHGPHEFEGTGIGLAIVSRIIVKHGGKVWAEGKVDEGATFYFMLPGSEN